MPDGALPTDESAGPEIVEVPELVLDQLEQLMRVGSGDRRGRVPSQTWSSRASSSAEMRFLLEIFVGVALRRYLDDHTPPYRPGGFGLARRKFQRVLTTTQELLSAIADIDDPLDAGTLQSLRHSSLPSLSRSGFF